MSTITLLRLSVSESESRWVAKVCSKDDLPFMGPIHCAQTYNRAHNSYGERMNKALNKRYARGDKSEDRPKIISVEMKHEEFQALVLASEKRHDIPELLRRSHESTGGYR